MAIGMLCGAIADSEAQWQAAVYEDLDPNDALAAECRSLLDQVFALAVRQMADDAFGLQLFLPQEPLPQLDPSMALCDWAQGFLYGFGLAGKAAEQQLSAEGREALQDFYEIGQLEVGEGELDEEQQQAATEIEEYMRVAAMLVYEDMHAPSKPGGDHELH